MGRRTKSQHKRAYEMGGIVTIPANSLPQGTGKWSADEVEDLYRRLQWVVRWATNTRPCALEQTQAVNSSQRKECEAVGGETFCDDFRWLWGLLIATQPVDRTRLFFPRVSPLLQAKAEINRLQFNLDTLSDWDKKTFPKLSTSWA